jgi:inositol transport system substrate-binding protein
MKSVYLLLTRTNTVSARIIRKLTRNFYSHVSISLDEGCNSFYSFARRNYYLPFIAGLITEDVESGIFGKYADTVCTLYELKTDDETYDKINEKITEMMMDYDRYRFNIIGLFACYFGISYKRRHHFFCSQFVACLLRDTEAVELPKDANLIKPVDFCKLPELTELYRGKLKHLKQQMKTNMVV